MLSLRPEAQSRGTTSENGPDRARLRRGGQSPDDTSAPSPVFRLFPVLLALCSLSACRTAPPLSAVNLAEPDWRVQQGQAVWRSKKAAPEIAGELLVAVHASGRTFLQFTKVPLPFVVAQTTTNSWQIEFVADNRTYSGRGEPPAQVAWLQLTRCLAGTVPPAGWNWRKSGGGRWRLENKNTGEMLEGYLAP